MATPIPKLGGGVDARLFVDRSSQNGAASLPHKRIFNPETFGP